MGYLVKLIYVLAILIPTMNSSEALSNIFQQAPLETTFIQQNLTMNMADRFAASQAAVNPYNANGAQLACSQIQGMAQQSIQEGHMMEAKALGFYHGLVQQAAVQTGYNNC